MIIQIDTKEMIQHYEKELVRFKTDLDKLPKDRICARKKGGCYFYYLRRKDAQGEIHEQYLPAEKAAFIKECCDAKYLRKLIPALEKELSVMRSFEKGYAPFEKHDAWESLPVAYKQFATKRFFSNEEICHNWANEEFETNSYVNSSHSQYVTKNGEIVRSRIELIVADLLYDLGISYRYECRLDLPSGHIYPDFTIMHPKTLELYYIEIFGLMDNPEYEQNAFRKIAKYAASDYYANLIMFFDHRDAPISTVDIKRVISEKFM